MNGVISRPLLANPEVQGGNKDYRVVQCSTILCGFRVRDFDQAV